MSFTLGYNTNGFPHHYHLEAITVLAEIGYRSIAITLDHHALNPYDANLKSYLSNCLLTINFRNLTCVIETGARFLLDFRHKHQPTMLDADSGLRACRLDYLSRAIDIAADLNSPIVSLWSGARPAGVTVNEAWDHLLGGCRELLARAEARNVTLAFEPEPGMFIETMDQYRELRDRLSHPRFGLTLDLGHVHCLGDGDPAERILEFAGDLHNIHIEDMRRGVHEHLMFGEGEMDFPPIFAALREINYEGGVYVELSRHGHDAVNAARKAFEFLSKL